MTEFVERDIKIAQEGVINIRDIEHTLKKWTRKYGWKFKENEYNEKKQGSEITLMVNWGGKKKMSPYYECYIDVTLLGNNLKTVTIDGKKKKHGKIEIIITSFVIKDKEKFWTKRPALRMLREAYDYFVMGDTFGKFEEDLRADLKDLITDCKHCLKLKGNK